MKRIFAKTLLAATLGMAAMAPLAEAGNGNRVFIMNTGTPTTVYRMPSLNRAIISEAPVKKLYLHLDCVVAGTPVEFPNDIRISNPYQFTLAAGTMASYSAPFGNSGTVVLPELKPGKSFFVSNVVPGGITAGAACSASTL